MIDLYTVNCTYGFLKIDFNRILIKNYKLYSICTNWNSTRLYDISDYYKSVFDLNIKQIFFKLLLK